MNETGKGFFFFLFLDSAGHTAPVLGLLTSASLALEGSEGRKQDRGKGVALFWCLDLRVSQTVTKPEFGDHLVSSWNQTGCSRFLTLAFSVGSMTMPLVELFSSRETTHRNSAWSSLP